MTQPIRLQDIMAAELTKVRTLPATWLAFGTALIGNTLLGLLAGTDAVRVAGPTGTTPIAQIGTILLLPAYIVLAVPVFAMGGEFRGGQFRVSLTATPARGRLFAAKLLVSTAVTAMVAIVVVTPGYLLEHRPVDGLLPRIAAYLALGLVGFGFAALARAVVMPVAVLVILPVLVSPVLGAMAPGVVRLLPHEATMSFLAMSGGEPALGRPAGLAVVVTWAVVLVAAGWLTTARRDG